MFAEALRDARVDAGLSVARVAELSGTSRAAIADYEAGRKVPRVDTAERILEACARTYAPVELRPRYQVRLDRDVLRPLLDWVPDQVGAVAKAEENLAVIVDSDANAERLNVSWGQVKTIIDGTTVDGDELSVWRLHELRKSATHVLRELRLGRSPRLSTVAGGALVEADESLDVPVRAMDFLVRATQSEADPAYIRHQVGGYLAHHGYPWLWVPHQLDSEYRRALVACLRQGDGNLMASVLVASIEREQ